MFFMLVKIGFAPRIFRKSVNFITFGTNRDAKRLSCCAQFVVVLGIWLERSGRIFTG